LLDFFLKVEVNIKVVVQILQLDVLNDLVAGLNLDFIRETLELGELTNGFNEVICALRWV
jgi:hypothetical protein